MRYGRSIIARQLRRVARLLRYADYLSAKLYVEKTIAALKEYGPYLKQISELAEQDSTQAFRKFSNFFTMADTETNKFFKEAQRTFNQLHPPIMEALEKAEKANTEENLQRAIYAQTDNLNKLLRLFDGVKEELLKTASRSSRNSTEYRVISNGTISWQEQFVFNIQKALGLK